MGSILRPSFSGGALRVARGLRGYDGEARRQSRLLSDGGHSGSCSRGEAYRGWDPLRYHQRSFRVSGAGAKPSVKTHFVSVNESAGAYGAPRHRHTPEIETMLRRVGEAPEVTFVPHLIPITRGELETIVVDVGEVPGVEEVLGWYGEDYEGWAFVEAREEYPQVAHVANTNRCRLSAAVDGRAGKLLLFSAVDNLLKGASGAALQNMNLALGYEEYLGLEHLT